MRLREIFRYELQHRLRSATTWIYGVVLLLLGFVMIVVDADGSSATFVNAPSRLALLATIAGMAGMLVSAAFFSDGAIRDYDARMDALLFTSPIRKLDYLGGRYLAALLVNAVLLLAVPIGSAIATVMPFLERSAFGPFMPSAFVQAYLLFLLPNLLFTSAVLFTVAVLTRQSMAVYLATIGIFVGYVLVLNVGDGNALLNVLSDPIGVRVLNSATERWTPVERNSRLLGGVASLFLNRAVWIAIAAGVLAVLHHRFSFAGSASSAPVIPTKKMEPSPFVAVPRFARGSAGTFGFRVSVLQLLAITRRSISEVVGSPLFLLLLVAKVGLTVVMGWDAGEGVFDTSTTPLTILIFERISETPLVPVTYLVVAIFAGELVWRNRDAGVSEISDAAPVSEGTELTGSFLALVVALALLQVPVLVGGIIAQAAQNYFHFEIALYLKVLFGMQLADLVLLAALAMLIHVIVNQKYLGHLVVVSVFVARAIIRGVGWIEHHLLLYGTDPGWKYSDMNGFGPFLRPFVSFKLYWGAWAMLLLIGAVLVWVRGREFGFRHRIATARARFTGPVVRATATAVTLILLLGGFAFYNTNILNDYRSATKRGATEARYEKQYRRYLDAPRPTLTDLSLRVEIYPEQSVADLAGTYRLINRTTSTIDSIHLYINPELVVRSALLDRASRAVVNDEATGYRVFALAQPLVPGDSLNATFDVSLRRRAFGNGRASASLASNGTWIDRRYLPFVGYQPQLELEGDARERFGLGLRPTLPTAANPGN
ncbi:MAG: hypothetical protein ABIW79_02880, partial [Gemmatimonas sp.]